MAELSLEYRWIFYERQWHLNNLPSVHAHMQDGCKIERIQDDSMEEFSYKFHGLFL